MRAHRRLWYLSLYRGLEWGVKWIWWCMEKRGIQKVHSEIPPKYHIRRGQVKWGSTGIESSMPQKYSNPLTMCGLKLVHMKEKSTGGSSKYEIPRRPPENRWERGQVKFQRGQVKQGSTGESLLCWIFLDSEAFLKMFKMFWKLASWRKFWSVLKKVLMLQMYSNPLTVNWK